MALPVSKTEVSGFSVQVSVFLFFFLTPDTLRFGAWNLIFYNAPLLQQTAARGKEFGSLTGGSPKPGPLGPDSLLSFP